MYFQTWSIQPHILVVLERKQTFLFSGHLRLKMQKIHQVHLVRLILLKLRELIERHSR